MYLLACCLIALRCALCLTDRGTEEAAARRLSLLGGCRCPARIEGALQPQTGDTGEIRHRTLLIDHRSLQYHVATRRCTTEHFSAPAILYITIWAAAMVVRFFLIDFSKRSSDSNLKRAFCATTRNTVCVWVLRLPTPPIGFRWFTFTFSAHVVWLTGQRAGVWHHTACIMHAM